MASSELNQTIKAIQTQLNDEFYEREKVIEGVICALLSGSHLFLLGKPGTAKSLVIQNIVKRIVDSSYFQWLLTPFSAPEELFGPPSLKALENDEWKRVIDGKMPTADIAFVDEIFKANSSILNSLLTLLNERQFDNGTKRLDCPLISCFGASNELPQDESLQALFDRFVFKYNVEYIKEGENWELLMKSVLSKDEGTCPGPMEITKDQLVLMQKEVRDINFPDSMITKLREIKGTLAEKEINPSDRKWVNVIPGIKAKAYLDGKDVVDDESLEILSHMLWEDPKQINDINGIILNTVAPAYYEATQLLDEATEIYRKYSPNMPAGNLAELASKLRSNLDEIDRLHKLSSNSRVAEIKNKIGRMYRTIVQNTLG